MDWKLIWVKTKMYGGYILLGIVAVVAFALLAKEESRLREVMKLLQTQSEDYRKQIEQLQRIKTEEEQRHRQIEATYQETLRRIETEKNEALRKLAEDKKEEIQQIIIETQDDPDALARRINRLFGIPIYEETNPTNQPNSSPGV